MIRPPLLREGDTVGIVSPTSPISALRPNRFERGIRNLAAMGFEVRAGEHARAVSGHTAGTAEQRVSDLHAMFSDDEVRAIICSIGGHNSNALLERLDYALIRRNPKMLIGYSDPTFLLLGIHRMTGLVTFHGPALMPQFGEPDGPHPYTEHWFRKTLMSANPPGELRPSRPSIHNYLEWDRDDTRPRREEPHRGPQTVKPGRAEGPLVAGNLCTIAAMASTRYFPDLDGAILCVEISEGENTAWTDRYLTHLRLLRAFEKASALVVGRTHPASGFSDEASLEEMLLAATDGSDLPVATGFDFGHTDPMLTLPIGTRASVDFAGGEPTLVLIEGAVKSR